MILALNSVDPCSVHAAMRPICQTYAVAPTFVFDGAKHWSTYIWCWAVLKNRPSALLHRIIQYCLAILRTSILENNFRTTLLTVKIDMSLHIFWSILRLKIFGYPWPYCGIFDYVIMSAVYSVWFLILDIALWNFVILQCGVWYLLTAHPYINPRLYWPSTSYTGVTNHYSYSVHFAGNRPIFEANCLHGFMIIATLNSESECHKWQRFINVYWLSV